MILLKRDFSRAMKSIYIQIGLSIILIFAVMFSVFIGTGQKIGISVFGNITTYKNLSEVAFNGLNYSKGLGFFITLIIALFIAQDYQYNTWQHSINANNNRIKIYLSRYVFSILLSISVFLAYEVIIYLVSFIVGNPFEMNKFVNVLYRGSLIYLTLSSIVVFISMATKNHIFSIALSIIFILFEQDFISFIVNIFGKFKINTAIAIKYTLMSINSFGQVENANILKNMLLPSVVITILLLIIGITLFRKYEL